MTSIPSAYREGYAKAGLHDQAAAGNYVKHTMIGDTALDPIMDELSSLPPPELHKYIGAGIEQRTEILNDARRSCAISSRLLMMNLPGSTMKHFVRGSAPSMQT